MNIKEKEISDINEGRLTKIVMGHLGPYLSKLKEAALSDLKNTYRTGPHELALYMSSAAKLVALEDLEVTLQQSITLGESAGEIMEKGNPHAARN